MGNMFGVYPHRLDPSSLGACCLAGGLHTGFGKARGTLHLLGIVLDSWGDRGLPGSQLGPNPQRGRTEDVAE